MVGAVLPQHTLVADAQSACLTVDRHLLLVMRAPPATREGGREGGRETIWTLSVMYG